MIEYIKDNSEFLNVAIAAATLVVWILYFQILFITYRQQKRPNILINRGAGRQANSRCLISNMSANPIYLQVVMLTIESGRKTWQCAISDVAELADDATASNAVEETHQGPLADGDFIDIGSFASIVRKASKSCAADDPPPDDLRGIDMLKITVAAIYTGRNAFVGASRTFDVVPADEGMPILKPRTIFTRQHAGRSARRRLTRQVTDVM